MFSARDAARAIRKRLQTQMGKNNAIIMFTLTVLETCVKNCNQRFRAFVCQKDFVNEMVKLIGSKFDAPQIIQERVLGLIQVIDFLNFLKWFLQLLFFNFQI